MSFHKIKDAAITLFNERGYEGASLADIAEVVGIKKSSIYNHYKNKDDLFLHIFETACADELANCKKVLSKDILMTKKQFLNQFLYLAKGRIINNASARFVFRFTMFPPHHFTEELGEKISSFIEELHNYVFLSIKESDLFNHLIESEVHEIASHYIILLRGTYATQLAHMYGNPSTKIDDAWKHFEKMFIEKSK